jgi:hypothetical protein
LQGVPTIVYSILRYSNLEMMIQCGLGAVVTMTGRLSSNKVCETFQCLDFLDKIPSLASTKNAKQVSSNAAGLLGSEGTVKFMVNTMTAFPKDAYVATVVNVFDSRAK